jgi:selenocysteine lyase/cysteine desulfurase
MACPLDRRAFPVTSRYVYLNHAGVNALPAPVADAMSRWARSAADLGSLTVADDQAHAETVRETAARLMGVSSAEVAFVKNTTEGLGFVANGLDWEPGDRVIVPGEEFPSVFYPWKALESRGVIVDIVAPRGRGRTLPLEAFVEVISSGRPPKLVALSWVQFGRGWRTDLAALAEVAHEAGALVCADVIQGLGVLPARLGDWGVDFAAADAHKWLLGPPGIGVLYVRRSCLEALRPLEPGWASVAHREQWDNLDLVWDETARRLEGGTPNVGGIYGLGAALEMLMAADVGAIWQHVNGLCERLCDGLREMGADLLSDRSAEGGSGIVTFRIPRMSPDDAVERLLLAGIVCSPRGGGLRVSPHGYNTSDEIDLLLDTVAAVVDG